MSVSAAPNELTAESTIPIDTNQEIPSIPGQKNDDMRVSIAINTDGCVANVNTKNEGHNIPPEQDQRDRRPRRLPISAAFADREIALGVWKASTDRNDDVRDALGRMMGWVEELVRIHQYL
jgi:hypothetical protein